MYLKYSLSLNNSCYSLSNWVPADAFNSDMSNKYIQFHVVVNMSLCHGSDLFHSIRLKLTVVSSPESPRELLSQFFFPHFSPSGLWLARESLARRHHSVSVQMRSLILILSHLCGDGDGRGSKFFSSSLLRRCFLMWINEHCILNDHWISGRVFFFFLRWPGIRVGVWVW